MITDSGGLQEGHSTRRPSREPGGIRNTAATVRDSRQSPSPRPDIQSVASTRPEAVNTGYREGMAQRSNSYA